METAMETPGTDASAPKPGFDELMLAMDAVDTIRHEASLVEAELSSDERRNALKARLREYYAGQGIEVPDGILDEAVDSVGRDRFVFRPLEHGLARALATVWVRRWRYGTRMAAAVIAVVLAVQGWSLGYRHFVELPRERAEAERVADLETRLPAALDKAYAETSAAAREYGDEAAIALVEQHMLIAKGLIEAGDRDAARNAIGDLERMGGDLRRKIQLAALMEKAKDVVAEARAKDFDARAKAAMEPLLRKIEAAASSGNLNSLQASMEELRKLVLKAETPLEVRIVDREGVRSGVWRTNDGGKTRVYYLVVEALDPSGKPVPMEIRNFETGRTKTVTYWGVRVPKEEYDRVADDKMSDGVIDSPHAGRKPSGSLDIVWEVEAGDQMITEW